MPDTQQLVQITVVAIALGILAQVVAHQARLPSIVFLLLFGVLAGPDFLGWIDTRALGGGLSALVSVAVALILFEGGLQLHYLDLATVRRVVRNLVTIGGAVTLAGAAVASHWILDFGWPLAFLFGALATVTGPTVINPLLDRVRVLRHVDTVLRGEGILIDPIGAILTLVVLELVLTSELSPWGGLGAFVSRMAIGVSIGLAGGWTLGKVLRVRGLFPQELKNLLVLAWVLGLFAVSQSLAHESGLAAVVIAGMVVRRESIPQQHQLRRFKGELSILFISILFILLSAHLPLAHLEAVGWRGVWTVLALMWIVRPLNVLASTWRSGLSWRERLFVMWISPRGVVAISIASFIAILLQADEPAVAASQLTAADGEALLALVFMTIAITVVVQGTTAPFVARLLGLRADEGGYVILIGANPLGRVVGRQLQEQGWDPLLIDTNHRACNIARSIGLRALVGNSLDPDVFERAQVESASVVAAVTGNQEINVLATRLASEDYNVPHVYPVLVEGERGVHEGLVEGMGGEVAFGRRIGVEQWSEDLFEDRAQLARVTVASALASRLAELEIPEDALPILTVRGDRAFLCHSGLRWQAGDVVVAVVRNNGQEELARVVSGGETEVRRAPVVSVERR